MIIKEEELPFYYCKHKNLAVLGQTWEENKSLRHQNISASLDGIDGSKAVDKMLLEVSGKIGEAINKLDGVGPVDNRPSTKQLHPFVHFIFLFIFFFFKIKQDQGDLCRSFEA